MIPAWITAEELAAYREGRLEPDRAEAIREAARAFPALRETLHASRRDDRRSVAADPTWFLPPPAVALGLERGARVADVLGSHAVAPGGRFVIPVLDVQDPDRRQVVVMRQSAGAWQVVVPGEPDEVLPLTALAGPNGRGPWRVQLTAVAELGVQHWAILFPTMDLNIYWSEPEPGRWAPLRAALARGEVPCVREDVLVARP